MGPGYESQKVTSEGKTRTVFNGTADYQMNSVHETKKLIDGKKD